jgi:hypothetical protein
MKAGVGVNHHGWDKDQAKWDKQQARWAKREAKWAARESRWHAREAHDQERPAHCEKSREEWEQIGKLALTALSLVTRAGIAGLSRLQSVETQEPPPVSEPPHVGASDRNSPASGESAVPVVVGALLVLLGFVWLILASGARLFSGFLVLLLLIGVLATVLAVLARRDDAKSDALPVAPLVTEQTVPSPRQATPRPASQQGPMPAESPLSAKLLAALQGKPAEPARDPVYYRRRARDYRLRIQRILKNRRRGPLTDAMAAAAQNVQHWEERVGQLVDRVITFEKDGIIQRDLREVPRDIGRLRRLSAAETDPEVRQQMMRTLSGFEAQQRLLDTLVRLMRRTRLQLDDTLAAMGTIYSQVQVLDAMDIAGPKAERIAEEIGEQVVRLNDLLSALGDAYSGAGVTDAGVTDAGVTDAGVTDAGVPGAGEPSEVPPKEAVRRTGSRQDHAAGG